MTKDIIEILKQNNWDANSKPATIDDINQLEDRFIIKIPEDYKQVLMFSNGGSLRGDFQTPLIIYHIDEVLVLHEEFDYYQDVPESLIFGADGGGTIYAYDLRDDQMRILFFRLGDARYDNIIYEAESLSDLILDVVSNKKIN